MGPNVRRISRTLWLRLVCSVKRGYIHGDSDKNATYPARDAAQPDDLAATMFSLLGIPPETMVRDHLNRPLPIASGKPITGVIA